MLTTRNIKIKKKNLIILIGWIAFMHTCNIIEELDGLKQTKFRGSRGAS